MLRLFLNGLNVAHSSLPIYGTDTHLRACSRAEIRAEGERSYKAQRASDSTDVRGAMNELEKRAVWTHPSLFVAAW